jgi:hypothetical protein
MKISSKAFLAAFSLWVFSPFLSSAEHANAKEKIESPAPCVFGRYVPERKDDFAWENDRIAFRMYGPALEADGEVSSGIDVWSKSTSRLVIDDWYRGEDYHNDHGEGADFYKVGPSRGCGGLAIWHQGKMYPSRNWASQRILESSPERLTFQLVYNPWEAGPRKVWETKTISLSAGSNLNRIESVLSIDRPDCLTVAMGIALRAGEGEVIVKDLAKGLLMYWEPANGANGHTGCAVLVDPDRLVDMIEAEGHLIALVTVHPGQPLVYYAGACWSKNKDFPDATAWETYLRDFVEHTAKF